MRSTRSVGMMPFQGANLSRKSDSNGPSLGFEETTLPKSDIPGSLGLMLGSSCVSLSLPSEAVTAADEEGDEERDSAISECLGWGSWISKIDRGEEYTVCGCIARVNRLPSMNTRSATTWDWCVNLAGGMDG